MKVTSLFCEVFAYYNVSDVYFVKEMFDKYKTLSKKELTDIFTNHSQRIKGGNFCLKELNDDDVLVVISISFFRFNVEYYKSNFTIKDVYEKLKRANRVLYPYSTLLKKMKDLSPLYNYLNLYVYQERFKKVKF